MTTQSISKLKAISLYSIVSFFLFFEMAVQVSPSVMAPELMHDLHLNAFQLGIMSGIYFYSYAIMQIPSGILFDRYNPRWIISLSILTCAIGTLLFALTPNIYIGSLARLLMGTGSAFAFVSVLVVTADLFPTKYFAAMTGITQMLAAFGAMMGQMPLSLLVNSIGWRETLMMLVIVGIVLAMSVWKLLVYQTVRETSHDTTTNLTSKLVAISRNPQTWFIAIYACLLWAPMSSFASLWGVPYLMHADTFSPTQAAFLCSMMWLGLALASPVLGYISTHINQRKSPLIISALLGAIAFGSLLLFKLNFIGILLLLFLSGAACSGQALSFTLVKENNPLQYRASAIAFNNMAVVISGAFFQPLIGKIIETYPTFHAENFKLGFSIIFGSYLLAFLIALVFIRENSKLA